MKHRVDTLTNGLLDAAVALAEGWELYRPDDRLRDRFKILYVLMKRGQRAHFTSDDHTREHANPDSDNWSEMYNLYSPTSNAKLCMDIMERERIGVASFDGEWNAVVGDGAFDEGRTSALPTGDGRTAGLAVMRAYVTGKFGEEVELP